MYPSKLNWQMIISQTKTFDIYPGSIPKSSISKILSTNCNRYTFDYIPNRHLWLTRVYFEILNFNETDSLTINCHNFNSIGPSKYRTTDESDNSRFVIIIETKKVSFQ